MKWRRSMVMMMEGGTTMVIVPAAKEAAVDVGVRGG
jgi:hypothetical protein